MKDKEITQIYVGRNAFYFILIFLLFPNSSYHPGCKDAVEISTLLGGRDLLITVCSNAEGCVWKLSQWSWLVSFWFSRDSLSSVCWIVLGLQGLSKSLSSLLLKLFLIMDLVLLQNMVMAEVWMRNCYGGFSTYSVHVEFVHDTLY